MLPPHTHALTISAAVDVFPVHLPLAPLTLRILNINSQERTGFLILLYLLPLLPGVKRHALSLLLQSSGTSVSKLCSVSVGRNSC